VDIWLDVEDVRVPKELAADDAKGKVNGLYQFELLAAPRGSRWYLTRRTSEEDSVACRSHADLRDPAKASARHIYFSTAFLAKRFRVNKKRNTLAYSLTLGVRVPDYEVERRFWPDRHYEGQYLFRDSLVLEMRPPADDDGDWQIDYDWESDKVGGATTPVPVKQLRGGKVEVTIPFSTGDATAQPGIKGQLRFVISEWNV